MKFAVAVLIGAVAAVRIQQKAGGDDFEAEAKKVFDDCAGGDGSLDVNEAVACAKKHGHGDKAGMIKKHWPKAEDGSNKEMTFDDMKKAYEEHEGKGLAQKGEDSDMSEGEAKEIFDHCAGDDGSLSLKEAVKCAKDNGHGKHVKGMKKHWPKDDAGKPIEITWDDAKKAWEEHNAKGLAQKDDGDMSEGEAKEIFDHCAGDDKSLSLKEAVKCAKDNGHGKHVKGMKKHWPKDAEGKPIEITWDDAKKAWEEHNSKLAQKDDGDMSEGEAKDVFDHCAGKDGSLSLKEAVKCAKDNGHGEHVKGMKKHWPKDAEGKPIEITWDDAKKAWEEHNSKLAQKGKKGGDKEDDVDPKEIFDFCAGDDGILEMHEAQKCAAGHVSDMIAKHWPLDDNGKPAKASWEDMQKWMEEHK